MAKTKAFDVAGVGGGDVQTSSQISQERAKQLAKDWSGVGYRAYRRVTNGETTYASGLPIGEETVKMAHEFDTWLDSGSYNGKIYRGINLTDDQVSSLEVGAVVDQMGISSWSKDKAVAEKFSTFGDDNQVVLSMDRTKRGRDIEAYSDVRLEREVTLSSKSSQVIRKIRRKSGIIFIDLEEV